MILVIRSDSFYSIGASCVAKIITPSDPTRETDHLAHNSSEQSDPNRIPILMIKMPVGVFHNLNLSNLDLSDQ